MVPQKHDDEAGIRVQTRVGVHFAKADRLAIVKEVPSETYGETRKANPLLAPGHYAAAN